VKVELAGFTPVVFHQEDYGAPESYQLVFLARSGLVEERPEALRAFLGAIADATLFLLAHPERAKARFFEALPHLRDELNLRAYDRTVPIFVGAPCHNDPDRWAEGQRFLFEQGIIPQQLPLPAGDRRDVRELVHGEGGADGPPGEEAPPCPPAGARPCTDAPGGRLRDDPLHPLVRRGAGASGRRARGCCWGS